MDILFSRRFRENRQISDSGCRPRINCGICVMVYHYTGVLTVLTVYISLILENKSIFKENVKEGSVRRVGTRLDN